MKKIFVLCLLVLFAVSCATTKRAVTNTTWVDSSKGTRMYFSYWEGSCGGTLHPWGGCSAGESHIKYCSVEEDNSLKCTAQLEADKVLNQ